MKQRPWRETTYHVDLHVWLNVLNKIQRKKHLVRGKSLFGQELMVDHWRRPHQEPRKDLEEATDHENANYWIIIHGLVSCISYTVLAHLPKDGTALRDWILLYLLTIKKKCPTGVLIFQSKWRQGAIEELD